MQNANNNDDFTARMMTALNEMLLDMLAAVARKDYEDTRKRQAQGIKLAKEKGKYKGKPIDQDKRDHIAILLNAETSWRQIAKLVPCSQSTIAIVKKEMA